MGNKPVSERHGMSRTPEWEAWRAMQKRCYNPNTRNYDRYGGRGITVCDRWRESFANFIADMGRKPSPRHSLDRINNDGNYEPGNCRWATRKTQCNNRHRPRKFIAYKQRAVPTEHPVNFVDLTGQVFGRWEVLGYAGCVEDKDGRSAKGSWQCRCECGAERPVVGTHLQSGRSKSCGCLHKEMMAERCRTNGINRKTLHGLSKTREHAAWNQMIQRCHNPKNPTYARYGAIGVTVCERWRTDFLSFLADMGQCPTDEHTLDRIDPFGNYEPTNCRWATREVQRLNQRRTRRFEYQGREMTLPELAKATGFKWATLRYRLVVLGWTVERATSQDPAAYHNRTGV